MKFLSIALFLSSAFAFAASRGAYEVPVPESLRDFAHYEFDELRVRVKNGERLEVRYQLPLALTGLENHLRFEGPIENGVAYMKDDQGEMTCVLAESMCQVKYGRLNFDLTKAEEVLRGMDLSEAQVAAHLQVSARFGGDMEGVLYFRQVDQR